MRELFIFVTDPPPDGPHKANPIPATMLHAADTKRKSMNMEEMIFCQCCGMPLQAMSDHGTEADGTASADYCAYCYKDGAFTQECTMEEMIQLCAQFHEEFKHEDGRSYTREEAVAGMRQFFPNLKRWQK